MSDDDYCIHDMLPGTCVICSGTDWTATRGTRSSGTSDALDTPEAIERYRSYYPGEREATFEAYVEVFFRLTGP